MELKEVVTDILPKITSDNLEHIDYDSDEDDLGPKSHESMLAWLSEFFDEISKVDLFY